MACEVFTIGIGTAGGEVIEGEGWKVRVKLDEAVLKDVATQTRGEYHHADSARELDKIYRGLGTRFVLEKKETEITSWFTAAGAALAAGPVAGRGVEQHLPQRRVVQPGADLGGRVFVGEQELHRREPGTGRGLEPVEEGMLGEE